MASSKAELTGPFVRGGHDAALGIVRARRRDLIESADKISSIANKSNAILGNVRSIQVRKQARPAALASSSRPAPPRSEASP